MVGSSPRRSLRSLDSVDISHTTVVAHDSMTSPRTTFCPKADDGTYLRAVSNGILLGLEYMYYLHETALLLPDIP